jgi:membrane protease YdiL (CAAX protease family)
LFVEQGQAPSPARAGAFFTTVLLAGIGLSILPPILPDAAGLILRQLSMFVGISLLFTAFLETQPLRQVFRLRGLSIVGIVKSLFLGLLSWGLVYVMTSLILLLVRRLGGEMYQPYPELETYSFPVALLLLGLLPAFCEEFAFRGYVLYSLGPMGSRVAIILTGLLFGALHLSLIRLIPLSLLGMVFATAAHRTGSILPSMIMHFVNNATVLGLSYGFRNAGDLTSDMSMPDPGGITLLFLVIATAALGMVVWAMVHNFSPDDLASPPAEAPPLPETVRAPRASRWLLLVVPLLPAILIYTWAASMEVIKVFRTH